MFRLYKFGLEKCFLKYVGGCLMNSILSVRIIFLLNACVVLINMRFYVCSYDTCVCP